MIATEHEVQIDQARRWLEKAIQLSNIAHAVRVQAEEALNRLLQNNPATTPTTEGIKATSEIAT